VFPEFFSSFLTASAMSENVATAIEPFFNWVVQQDLAIAKENNRIRTSEVSDGSVLAGLHEKANEE